MVVERAHQVRMTQDGGGPPILEICLGSRLVLREVEALAGDVLERVEAIAGLPFSLLIDTRAVMGADPGAPERLARLEATLAGRGLLKVAHVVRAQALPLLKPRLAAQYAALGHPDLIGTFDDPVDATRFVAAAGPDR